MFSFHHFSKIFVSNDWKNSLFVDIKSHGGLYGKVSIYECALHFSESVSVIWQIFFCSQLLSNCQTLRYLNLVRCPYIPSYWARELLGEELKQLYKVINEGISFRELAKTLTSPYDKREKTESSENMEEDCYGISF